MTAVGTQAGFVHEALLYAGDAGFLEGTVPFIVQGVESGEPVMVAVSAARIELLRSELNGHGDAVSFVDMELIGGNPARIIPAWDDFVSDAGAGPVRGIGEPIGPDRSPAALVECQHHEVLLNLAFASRPGWWLLCPYDVEALDRHVIDEAVRSHPFVLEGGAHRESASYSDAAPAGVHQPLPEPTTAVQELHFRFGRPLAPVRRFVSDSASRHGLEAAQVAELLVAVNELVTNSVCHGGGEGVVRVWHERDEVVCEVRDRGLIDEPLAGRRLPTHHHEGGRGLWIVNQLCDLVQIRSTTDGTVVRLHFASR